MRKILPAKCNVITFPCANIHGVILSTKKRILHDALESESAEIQAGIILLANGDPLTKF